jgi:hypothetical protein
MAKGNPHPSYRIPKGTILNPYGAPKISQDFKKSIKEKSIEALKRLEEISNNPKHREQLKALIWILEQAHGKANQPIVNDPFGEPFLVKWKE